MINPKGNVTQDDSQQRFLVQHSVASLLQYCFEINGYNIVSIFQCCVAQKIVVTNRSM